MSQTPCVRCRERMVDRRTVDHTCRQCRSGSKRRTWLLFRRGCDERVPPPSVDPTREDRIRRYEERAAAGLPLFTAADRRQGVA